MKPQVHACVSCGTAYDPTSQGPCPGCRRHPHLENNYNHDCEWCGSVRFPPRNSHLDVFEPIGTGWRRAKKAL